MALKQVEPGIQKGIQPFLTDFLPLVHNVQKTPHDVGSYKMVVLVAQVGLLVDWGMYCASQHWIVRVLGEDLHQHNSALVGHHFQIQLLAKCRKIHTLYLETYM